MANEIVGFHLGSDMLGVHVLLWRRVGNGPISPGARLTLALADYTIGAGSNSIMDVSHFYSDALLVTLSSERHGVGFLNRTVLLMRPREATLTMAQFSPLPLDLSGATPVTTDGSWLSSGNLVERLTPNMSVTCGAAMVLSKGLSFLGAV